MKKKRKQFTDKLNDAVQYYNPYGDLDRIEESKQILVSLQEYQDTELQRVLDGLTRVSSLQSGQMHDEISGP